MGLIKANFAELDALAAQIVATVEQVKGEQEAWKKTADATAEQWLDRAGGAFTEVSEAWDQVATAQFFMLDTLHRGVQTTKVELQQAMSSSAARIAAL